METKTWHRLLDYLFPEDKYVTSLDVPAALTKKLLEDTSLKVLGTLFHKGPQVQV